MAMATSVVVQLIPDVAVKMCTKKRVKSYKLLYINISYKPL